MDDQHFLHMAIDVGNKMPVPYNFGAVVVVNREVISQEHGYVSELTNPTLHAEITAIIAACQKLGRPSIAGAVLYASHEPCMMCLSCAAWADVSRIVYHTPAHQQSADMYEYRKPDITELAQRLRRPITIEHIDLP